MYFNTTTINKNEYNYRLIRCALLLVVLLTLFVLSSIGCTCSTFFLSTTTTNTKTSTGIYVTKPTSTSIATSREIIASETAMNEIKSIIPTKEVNMKLVVGTRIHLGKSSLQSQHELLEKQRDEYEMKLYHFLIDFCMNSCKANVVLIAVDVTTSYHLYDIIYTSCQSIITKYNTQNNNDCSSTTTSNNNGTHRCIRLESSSSPLSKSTEETTTSSSSMPNDDNDDIMMIRVLPIQPWGQFVLPLNAMIHSSLEYYNANYILFVSLETYASYNVIEKLKLHHQLCTTSTDTIESTSDTNQDCLIVNNNNNVYDDNVLVVGARLSGHDYHHVEKNDSNIDCNVDDDDHSFSYYTMTELNGGTSPWNTLALWNLKLLSLTGFILVSEGFTIHQQKQQSDNNNDNTTTNIMNIAGIEEVVTITLLQSMLGYKHSIAKLIDVTSLTMDQNNNSSSITWMTTFNNDPQRQKWHEEKMKSKLIRSEKQYQLLWGRRKQQQNDHHATKDSVMNDPNTSSVTSNKFRGIVHHG